jgi:hypothetical protein
MALTLYARYCNHYFSYSPNSSLCPPLVLPSTIYWQEGPTPVLNYCNTCGQATLKGTAQPACEAKPRLGLAWQHTQAHGLEAWLLGAI